MTGETRHHRARLAGRDIVLLLAALALAGVAAAPVWGGA